MAELPTARLRVALNLLKEAKLIRQSRDARLHLTKRQPKPEQFEQLADQHRVHLENDKEALERMIGYAQSGFCRWKVLMTYFGEEAFDQCGGCDNCLHPPSALVETAETKDESSSEEAAEVKEVFTPGMMVKAPKYGQGQVQAQVGEQVTVLFPDNETRTFLSTYLKPV
ncbi:ATP-dependent DNA helicase RecQ [Novimethylophilus kurashikiensis]|uniref:ATP-dependent DNA helicase RecQ n=1 Tax=Novimethylophilus kurashikiensis TaxID=1825523 RepID=A0A2R5FBF1_9PROT|nr:DUF3553 domain-containing protein [Novimethylophilus kurashikiensis]GBG15556.1 ATP-dependent DNA helicase RecQ [Novimethylophilus kurashikiensis]